MRYTQKSYSLPQSKVDPIADEAFREHYQFISRMGHNDALTNNLRLDTITNKDDRSNYINAYKHAGGLTGKALKAFRKQSV